MMTSALPAKDSMSVENYNVGHWAKVKHLSPSDVSDAMDLFNSEQDEDREFHQYYNLFDVIRRDITSVRWQDIPLVAKIAERVKVSEILGTPYFLKYIPGSFTKVHSDHETTRTVVTLIESQDLIGGDSLIYDEYGMRPRPPHKEAKRSNNQNLYGKFIIPRVIPMEAGDSLVYGPDLLHGVTQVEQGHRIVLITWWKK